MRAAGCRLLATLLTTSFALILPAQQQSAGTETPSQVAFTPDATPPHGTYPEIVRLSVVEGDVRLAPGKEDAKLTGNTWEQATAGIPLQSGFNLATGPNGRAEIEFEDASTIYLAPNSALSLAKLSTKDGVPHSILSLLSGTIALHVKPNIPGDEYRIETPTDTVGLNYGDDNYSRVTSYLDGLQVTPLEDTHLVLNRIRVPVPAGATYNLAGYGAVRSHTATPADLLAFDIWVKQRVIQRDAAMKLVMKEAGLKTPLPGLADLAGKGTFVPCPPYGTCWKPNDGWVQQQAQPQAQQQPQQRAGAPVAPAQIAGDKPASAQDQSTPIHLLTESSTPVKQGTMSITSTRSHYAGAPIASYDDLYEDDFPCNPYLFWYRRSLLLDTAFYNPAFYDAAFYGSYDWAVCHAGFWINRGNQYVWVVGTNRHHRCPVRWVKYQGKLGYVPSHPRDRHGAPPVNIRHGIYRLSDKPNHPGRPSIDRVAFEGKSPPKSLDETPRDFRNPAPPLLARANSPELGVHFMHESPRFGINGEHPRNGVSSPNRATNSLTRASASSLVFDQHSNRFMLASRVTEGGRTHTYTAPMSDHGGHIASASAGGYHPGPSGSAPSHAGYSGSNGGGGGHYSAGNSSSSSSGHSGGGFSGGGGSRGGGGGGGFSGGGGGSHGSGGSSGGSSSSSSGGAGGHH